MLLLGLTTSDYWAGLLTQGYTFAILAITADVLWGLTGILTFGSSAMFGIGAYTVGAFFVHGSFGAWTVVLALPVAVILAILVSVVLGWLVFYTRGKIGLFYVSLVTLGLSVVFQQIAVYGGTLTGGSNGLSGFRVGLLEPRGWYWVAAAALAIVLIFAYAISRSDFGLVLRAIKDHETRCRYLGMHTSRVKLLTFTACNAVASLAGCLYALHTTVVAPSLVDFLLATNVLIWVTLGGKGNLLGPALVAVGINVGAPTLNTLFPLYWQGILGLVFVIAVVALPDGLLPALVKAAKHLLPRSRRAGSDRRDESGPVLADTLAAKPDRLAAAALSLPAILNVENVAKRYGSFAAIKSVSFQVRRGELVSIVGPNGAGKTSLIRCISDGLDRSQGEILIDGHSIGRLPPERIVGLGLGRKFQGGSVFPGLSVAACILLASWKGKLPPLLSRSRAVSVGQAALAVIDRMGLQAVWNDRAGEISHGQRQALELAMVLALEPNLLLLDEPTAGLSEAERQQVGVVLHRLVADHDLAVVLIEHDFDFVKQISTRMLVLHDGRILADGSVHDVSASALVRDVYLGRQIEVA
jgi:branched-chain amino acid transport system permease protein